VAAVPSGPNWTPLPTIPIKKNSWQERGREVFPEGEINTKFSIRDNGRGFIGLEIQILRDE
jgi:hypothetical protein